MVLQSWSPQIFHDSQKCWWFSRTWIDLYDNTDAWVTNTVATGFELSNPIVVDGDLVFRLQEAEEGKENCIIIQSNATVLYICEENLRGGADEGTRDDCPICLSDIPYNPRACGSCGKRFHRACIGQWRRRSITCPHCRGEFDPEPPPQGLCQIS